MMMYGRHPYMLDSTNNFDINTYIRRLKDFDLQPINLPNIGI